jgi:hypothetical protein
MGVGSRRHPARPIPKGARQTTSRSPPTSHHGGSRQHRYVRTVEWPCRHSSKGCATLFSS